MYVLMKPDKVKSFNMPEQESESSQYNHLTSPSKLTDRTTKSMVTFLLMFPISFCFTLLLIQFHIIVSSLVERNNQIFIVLATYNIGLSSTTNKTKQNECSGLIQFWFIFNVIAF
jgi:hypothetical protein